MDLTQDSHSLSTSGEQYEWHQKVVVEKLEPSKQTLSDQENERREKFIQELRNENPQEFQLVLEIYSAKDSDELNKKIIEKIKKTQRRNEVSRDRCIEYSKHVNDQFTKCSFSQRNSDTEGLGKYVFDQNTIYYDKYFITSSFYLVIAHEITHALSSHKNQLRMKNLKKLQKKQAKLEKLHKNLTRLKDLNKSIHVDYVTKIIDFIQKDFKEGEFKAAFIENIQKQDFEKAIAIVSDSISIYKSKIDSLVTKANNTGRLDDFVLEVVLRKFELQDIINTMYHLSLPSSYPHLYNQIAEIAPRIIEDIFSNYERYNKQ